MNINDKIREIKIRVKQLTEHFSYSEDMINILTLCYFAFVSIDNDIEDIVEEVISRVYILLNDGRYNDLFKKLGVPLDKGGGYRMPDFDLEGIDNYEFIYINIFKIKILGQINMQILFDRVLHELKHAINCVVNAYRKTNNTAFFYCGISWRDFADRKKRLVYLDEAFNCFISRVYLRQIYKLKEYEIEDEGIRNLLNSLDEIYDYYAYDCTNLLLPLFQDYDYFKLFYNATLYKDFDLLFEELSKTFKSQSMKSLDALLSRYEKSFPRDICDYFRLSTKSYPKRELKI